MTGLDSILFVLAAMNWLLLISLLFYDIRVKKRELFSPTRIYLLFSLFSATGLFYYPVNINHIAGFEPLSGRGDPIALLYEVYFLYIITNIAAYVFLSAFVRVNYGILERALNSFTYPKMFRYRRLASVPKVIAFSFFALGVALLLYTIHLIGGIDHLWQNLGIRQQLLAGYGYILSFSQLAILVGALGAYAQLVKSRPWMARSFVVVAILMLGLLGGRAPIVFLIFSVLIVHHYTIRRINVGPSLVVVAAILVYLAVALGSFRHPGAVAAFSADHLSYLVRVNSEFIEHVLLYATNVKRDFVIVDYFKTHEYWHGSSYTSVLYAPIPSGLYLDKPPVDGGRYVVAMAQGNEVNPPVPVVDLPGYGWPEGNMAGFMNFGYAGLLVTLLAASLLAALVYRHMVYSGFGYLAVFLYASVIFWGLPSLSPKGIVDFLTLLLFLLLVSAAAKGFSLLARKGSYREG